MADILATIKAFLAIFPHPYKIMFILGLLAGLARFMPNAWQQSLGILGFDSAHPVLLLALFLFCTLMLSLTAGEYLYKEHAVRGQIKARLERLSDQEKPAVLEILRGGAVIAWPHDTRVLYLFNEGILWRVDSGFDNGQHSYGLTEIARRVASQTKSL